MFALDESKPVSYGMTGRLFEELYMKRNLVNLNNLFLRTILFSRMLPKHKAALLDHYAQIGQVTALVGENTRDASGFRQADLSLALTSGEMSSFAHFSSVGSRLSSIIDLLRVSSRIEYELPNLQDDVPVFPHGVHYNDCTLPQLLGTQQHGKSLH